MTEISKHESFYPSATNDLRSFMKDIVEMCEFMLGQPEHKYSLSFAKINTLKAFAESFDVPIQNITDKENELDEARKILETKKDDDIPEMNKYFNEIKASSGCTDSFLERYKIKGKTITIDTKDLKAEFKMIKNGLIHEFRYSKHRFEKLDMNFYIKKEGETSYHLLFTATSSPYKYTGVLSPGDLIFAVYNYKNEEVGSPSNIIAVNT